MYIRRKVFSKFQTESGEERYFSTTEYTLMSEAEQREFSKKDDDDDDKKSKKNKKEYKNESHRGYGRAFLVGGTGGIAGRYAGKRAVEKALKEGDDIETAKRKGKVAAGKVGAGVGAVEGLVAGAQYGGVGGAALGSIGRGVMGAVGGTWGTSRNNREWKRKHRDEDED